MSQNNNRIEELTRNCCIDLMPEWQGFDLKIESLTGGITNKLYRVQVSDGGDYVIRIYGKKTELFVNRDVEMENIRLMESSGITPRLIKYIPGKNVTIVEFIPGYVMKNGDFRKRELWKKIVRPIKIIHHSKITLRHIFNPLTEVQRMYKVFSDLKVKQSEFRILETINILERLSNRAQITPDQYVPCHNDLLADNSILIEDLEKYVEPMYLIDWEYAGMSTPYYDMADMFQEILLPREMEEGILREYWEGENMDYHTYMY